MGSNAQNQAPDIALPRLPRASSKATGTPSSAVPNPKTKETPVGTSGAREDDIEAREDDIEQGAKEGTSKLTGSNPQDRAPAPGTPSAVVPSPKIEEGNLSTTRTRQSDIQMAINEHTGIRPNSREFSGHDPGAKSRFENLFRRNRRALPITDPDRRSKPWFQPSKFLPDGVMQIRVAVWGFALYGTVSLLSSTQDFIKDMSVDNKLPVFLIIGFFWTMAAITVGFTMSGRTRFEHVLSHQGTGLALFWITVLAIFHIGFMLPQSFLVEREHINVWSAVGFMFLLCLAGICLIGSWIPSTIRGEMNQNPTSEHE